MTPKTLPERAYLRECFSYNRETGELRWRARPVYHFTDAAMSVTCNKQWAGRIAGSINALGRRIVRINRVDRIAARVIWCMETGQEPPIVDHINGIRSDDRFENLRAATWPENLRNAMAKGKRGLPKGVSVYRTGQFHAQIGQDYMNYHLGYFDTVEEAEAAYRAAALEMHGAFASFRSRPAKPEPEQPHPLAGLIVAVEDQ